MARYFAVRKLTEDLARPLSDADATIQSMPDASPAKWHLAHTTWFFETFILRDHVAGYQHYREEWPFLFNSYYEAEGARMARAARGMLSRPTLADILDYRAAVDAAMERAIGQLSPDVLAMVELGCQHEQQHQELLLTDILHAFSMNPLECAVWAQKDAQHHATAVPHNWLDGRQGLVDIGADTTGSADFAFDCEGPRHTTFLHPHQLADRKVTNGEWLAFMADGGYDDPRLWLSDGWAWRQAQGIEAPLYWADSADGWTSFTLSGRQTINPAAPVCHVSFFEADAFATWAGARLPTEAEWEAAAALHDSTQGNLLDGPGNIRPDPTNTGPAFFGDAWEWTGSAYRPYPGFRAAEGAIGEYNGKFMSGQFVLRGGSCATPRGHTRATYRNFFYPHHRWQFMGLRLARDTA
ncbi:ergothioneine biosynthesis protein EgtB [Novosphingobium sp. 17-62-19]|uniref:ergothioneine biosynthesis protein EgtB n=1 Tax=Novosphingobium sp. 17-62-19 TaxID=1970406 RepID=UPI0025E460A6|nr:ergothioneine biosynthesis protein EgtB [Novosphingobium sp. 17-62-19]HQS95284.1 ergothioneine biosynthesis protein EgtB [Novosphingobium sp.]